jgi:hypothetical protein
MRLRSSRAEGRHPKLCHQLSDSPRTWKVKVSPERVYHMANQETISHTETEQQNVERIENLDADELRSQFSALLFSSLRDDPNTEVDLEVAA